MLLSQLQQRRPELDTRRNGEAFACSAARPTRPAAPEEHTSQGEVFMRGRLWNQTRIRKGVQSGCRGPKGKWRNGWGQRSWRENQKKMSNGSDLNAFLPALLCNQHLKWNMPWDFWAADFIRNPQEWMEILSALFVILLRSVSRLLPLPPQGGVPWVPAVSPWPAWLTLLMKDEKKISSVWNVAMVSAQLRPLAARDRGYWDFYSPPLCRGSSPQTRWAAWRLPGPLQQDLCTVACRGCIKSTAFSSGYIALE